MTDLTKIFIRADKVQELLQAVSDIVYKHKDTENDAQCDEIMSDIDDYCEENQLNFDNPEFEQFYWTRLDKIKTINVIIAQYLKEMEG